MCDTLGTLCHTFAYFMIRDCVVLFIQHGFRIRYICDNTLVVTETICGPVNWHSHHSQFVPDAFVHLSCDFECYEFTSESTALNCILTL